MKLTDDKHWGYAAQESVSNVGESSHLRKSAYMVSHAETLEPSRVSGTLVVPQCSLRLTDQVIQDHLADLYHQDEERRIKAIQALEFLGKPATSETLDALEDALCHPSAAVRAAAADALSTLGGVGQKTVLLLAIADRSWDVRAAVVKALGMLGEAAPVLTLVRALRDKHEMVRIAAIWALQRLGLERLLAPLEYEEDIQSLSWVFPFELEPTLLSAMESSIKDESELVRAATIQALGEFRNPGFSELFVKALKDPSELVQLEAMHALTVLDDQVPLDEVLLKTKDSNELVREEAYKLLARLSSSLHRRITFGMLLQLLRDEREDLRLLAAWLLGEQREPRAINCLLAARQDESQAVQQVVNWALEQFIAHEEEMPEHSPQAKKQSAKRLRLIGEKQMHTRRIVGVLDEILEYLTERRGFIVVDGDEEEAVVLTIGYEQSPAEPKGALRHRLSHYAPVQNVPAASHERTEPIISRNLERVRRKVAHRSWSECYMLLLSSSRREADQGKKAFPAQIVINIIGFETLRSNDVRIDQCQERYVRNGRSYMLNGHIQTHIEETFNHIHLFEGLHIWHGISEEIWQSSEPMGQREQRATYHRRRRVQSKDDRDMDRWLQLWLLDFHGPVSKADHGHM